MRGLYIEDGSLAPGVERKTTTHGRLCLMIDQLPVADALSESKPTVLVVEDEVLIRLDICEQLRDVGFSVLEAASAEDALALLRAGHSVDAVFSDYQLLGPLDGWHLRQAVAECFPDMAFILTSAQDIRAEWQQHGVLFVPKPYRPETVLHTINRAISDA